jgi:acetyl-CoA carboxylase biotin carboxyl carrier protein
MMGNNKTKNEVVRAEQQNGFLSKLAQLYKLMCETNVEKLQTNFEGYNIKIKRFTKKEEFVNHQIIPQPSIPVVHDKVQETEQQKGNYEEITSPLNGVFYRAPSPTSKPFVNEGDIVSVGDVLCIIEAMKVMNEIKATKKCKIIKVLCQNGESVSIGTKLFLVEPA